MSITLVGTDTATATDGGDAGITGYTEPAVDDILLVGYSTSGNGTNHDMAVTDNVGTIAWNELVDAYNSTGGDDTNLGVFWARVSGTLPTTVTCSGNGNATDATAGIMYILRGVDKTTAIDSTTTEDNGANSQPNSPNIPSLTTTDGGAWVFSFVATEVDEAGGTITPSGMANGLEENGNDTNDCTIAGATVETGLDGSYDPAPWTGFTTGGSTGWLSATVALRPEATAALTPGEILLAAIRERGPDPIRQM